MNEHIFPGFDEMLSRQSKENLLGQRGACFWFTGLSGSGKTTLARFAEKHLHAAGHITMLLDGDNVRAGLNNNLGFTEEDRIENIRRIAEVGKLFTHCGIITLACFVSPTRDIRKLARTIIGADDFYEIFVDTPLEVCEQRDVKGLYKKARAGEVKHFTGISAPFEAPESPALRLPTAEGTPEEMSKRLCNFIVSKTQPTI